MRRCAKKAARTSSGNDEDDLFQAGRIGVLRAIEKFDPKRGAWTQFAKQYIRVEMDRGVVDLRENVRVPHETAQAVRAVRRLISKAEAEMTQAIRSVRRRVAKDASASSSLSEDVRFLAQTDASSRFVTSAPSESSDEGRSHPRWSASYRGASGDTDIAPILTKSFYRAMACLTPQEVRVFLAITVQEKTVKEVAEAEGYEERWGTGMYRRAVEKMRTFLGAVQTL